MLPLCHSYIPLYVTAYSISTSVSTYQATHICYPSPNDRLLSINTHTSFHMSPNCKMCQPGRQQIANTFPPQSSSICIQYKDAISFSPFVETLYFSHRLKVLLWSERMVCQPRFPVDLEAIDLRYCFSRNPRNKDREVYRELAPLPP